MPVVRVPAALRDLVDGNAQLDVAGATVRDILTGLPPKLHRRVIDESGALRPHVNVFLGADNIRDLEGLDSAVASSAEVSILPAVSGG